MQFPNALEGVKKIYKAEIIALIGGIVGFVAAILALVGAQSGSEGGLAGAGFLIIAASVLFIIAFIMNIVGLNKAKPDEENFKNALTMVIIGIIAGILLGATKEGTLLNSLGDNLSKVCGLLANYFVCTAVMNLAGQLGDEAMAKKAFENYDEQGSFE